MITNPYATQNSGQNKNRLPLEEIKTRLDLVGLAQELHPSLKKRGSNIYQGGHDGVHPSANGQCLTVWPETNTWKCFNCGQGGDVIDLLGVSLFGVQYQANGPDFQRAAQEAAARAGLELAPLTETQKRTGEEKKRVYSLLTEAARFFHAQLEAFPDITAHLKENYGFTRAFIEQKALGFAPPASSSNGTLVEHLKQQGYSLEEMKAASIVNKGGYCRYQGRIMFPYWQQGQVVYFAARATAYTPPTDHETLPGGEFKKYRKLKLRDAANLQISEWITNEVFFGIDNLKLARKRGYILIAEGLPDQLAAEQAGEPCISPGTTHFNQMQLEQLTQAIQGLKAYVCFDNELNRAGEKGALAIARLLEEQGNKVYLMKLPRPEGEGIEKIDLCEFLRDMGVAALAPLYKAALRLPDYLLANQRLPEDPEEKAALVNELAQLAIKVCRYDKISLTSLQNKVSDRLKVDASVIRSMFREQEKRATDFAEDDTEAIFEKKSHSTLIVEMAADFELFHTSEPKAYATLEVEGHYETWSIRSRGFKLLIKDRFYRQYQSVPRTQALEDALSVLEAKALRGPEIPVYGRLAQLDGCIYLDLSNERWEVVKISPQGWEILKQAPVKFRRTNGVMALPHPQSGGTLEEMRNFINVTPQDWKLLAAWMVAAFNPDCQYPVLTINGEQGSAKSTACRFIRRLLDPSVTLLRTTPKDERDFWIAAQNNWILAYDNLSGIAPWLSDTLCRVSTGGGNATRLLFSDDEEVFFDARRPVLLNGIDAIATRSDLLERSLILNLPAIEEERRKSEKQLAQEFERALPRILGGLLASLSVALSRINQIKLERLPRMADFTLWAVAAEPAFGGPQEPSFLEVYTNRRADNHLLALEASPLAQAFVRWYEKYSADFSLMGENNNNYWLGPAASLLAEIEDCLDEADYKNTLRQFSWPKNARALSVQLHRLAPDLRAMGIDLTFDVYAGEIKRGIAIRPVTVKSGTQSGGCSTQTSVAGTQNGEHGTPNPVTQKICVPDNQAGFEAKRSQAADFGTQNTQKSAIFPSPLVEVEGQKNALAGEKKNEEICVICVPCVPDKEQLTEPEATTSYQHFVEAIAANCNDYQALLVLSEEVMSSQRLAPAQRQFLTREIKSYINRLLYPPLQEVGPGAAFGEEGGVS